MSDTDKPNKVFEFTIPKRDRTESNHPPRCTIVLSESHPKVKEWKAKKFTLTESMVQGIMDHASAVIRNAEEFRFCGKADIFLDMFRTPAEMLGLVKLIEAGLVESDKELPWKYRITEEFMYRACARKNEIKALSLR